MKSIFFLFVSLAPFLSRSQSFNNSNIASNRSYCNNELSSANSSFGEQLYDFSSFNSDYSSMICYESFDGSHIDFTSVVFKDKNNGWIVGNRGVILHTVNGGKSWIQQYKPLIVNEWREYPAIYPFDLNTVFIPIFFDASVRCSKILKTTNAGNSWAETSPDCEQITFKPSCISFPTASIGFIAGVYRIMKTQDGGKTWQYVFNENNIKESNTTLRLNSMYFLNSERGLVVGNLYHETWGEKIRNEACYLLTNDGGLNWKIYILSDKPSNYSYTTKYTLNAICFAEENTAFLVDSYGCIHKSTNSGNTWSMIRDSGKISSLNAIYFVDANLGFAVGEKGVFLRTIDGGVNWKEIFVGTDKELKSVYFIDKLNGFVAGRRILLKTTNGGSTWLKVDVKVELPLEN